MFDSQSVYLMRAFLSTRLGRLVLESEYSGGRVRWKDENGSSGRSRTSAISSSGLSFIPTAPIWLHIYFSQLSQATGAALVVDTSYVHDSVVESHVVNVFHRDFVAQSSTPASRVQLA